MAEPTTRADHPPAEGGRGGKKILGMPRSYVIVGGVALGAGLLYYVWKSRQPQPGQGKPAQQAAHPGMGQQSWRTWIVQHQQGHHHHRKRKARRG